MKSYDCPVCGGLLKMIDEYHTECTECDWELE